MVRGFFLSCGKASPGLAKPKAGKEDTMATREQSFCKITLFLIKDWDSFQIAMRGCLHGGSRRDTQPRAEQGGK
ncbi:MAG: hypothetical protein C4531_14490 [Desulfurivibrio sp.]|nr:MAG: hypothetical protein C4531_14490 [Desulfurivibrio sp.]